MTLMRHVVMRAVTGTGARYGRTSDSDESLPAWAEPQALSAIVS